ncbi:lytic transglycosylase [Limoniibacter endophyticus]|uniref:Lytic transglycosylase n=2 Tax=Limoniibacter endophyticus TaxID=1565040 RepID=A0A8J3DRA3_9HYPH|nr:lytic transglycosylase [Limoniibacter endophyticus]
MANDALSYGPIPQQRPESFNSLDTSLTTGAISGDRMATPARGGSNMPVLKAGLDALARGNVATALASRDRLPSGSLDRQILTWALVHRASGNLNSGEIAAASAELRGWPGAKGLRAKSERALLKENPAPQLVLQAFGNTKPETIEGAQIKARAHIALGQVEQARNTLAPFWRKEKLDAKDEQAIIREFGSVLSRADHRVRMEAMLYIDRITSAERVAGLAGAESLLKAWAAATRNEANAAALLGKVPAAQRSAGYIFAKARYERRKERFTQAAQTILQAPKDLASLIDPDAWWVERRVLSRELLDVGKPDLAYKVAAQHTGGKPSVVVDAEFHAGWFALRGTGNAKAAAHHFNQILRIADGPISRSRGYYWLGRAAEAGGGGNAQDYYRRAAQYGATYYGQLAGAKLGLHSVPVPYPSPTPSERLAFESRPGTQAIKRLIQADHASLATPLYFGMASELTSPGELALLAVLAEKESGHYLSLKVGKIAANRGLEIGALAHPLGAIPDSARIGAAGKALAYAIARQESEFNVGAISPVGAAGLLQLMPGTAQEMAKKTGLGYSKSRLTSDAAYNATLGAAYLAQQLENFNGSYIMTFAGYNAGPRRAREWAERYGDPRGKDIDAVVDWVERIPFTETRSYVQRVMENYQVYKMRLTGSYDITADLINGR